MKNIFILESQIYASLSHPKRLEILHLLQHGELSVHQITEMAGISQANVSQHLMVLKRLKLVTSKKQAQHRVYSLVSTSVPAIFDAARALLLSQYGVREIDVLNRHHLHIDPVCHMEVTAKGAAASSVHNHARYYFCARGCQKKFDQSPEKYIGTLQQVKEAHV